MHVDTSVVVLAKLLLQRRNKLPQRLAFVSHHIRDQQAVQQAIALRKMLRDADTAGLLATDENRLRGHQIDPVLEAEAVLMPRAAMLGCNAVEHLRRIECARNVTRPTFALEQPVQQHREDLVCINDVAVLIHSADAVRIAVRDQSGVALEFNNRLLRRRDMRQDGLWINARKRWVQFVAELDKRNTRTRKDAGDIALARTV